MQDTESLWQNFLVKKKLLTNEALLQKKELFSLTYEAGILNFHDVIQFSLEPIAHMDIYAQLALRDEFTQTVLKHNIIPQAIDLVTSHYAQGHTVLIISAGHEFLIEPAARFFPVHAVLCTTLKRSVTGAYAPFLEGNPLYRKEKIYALERWLRNENLNFLTTYFYSDSINDLPLLEYVTFPTVANPCARLKSVALTRNWPILELKALYKDEMNKIS